MKNMSIAKKFYNKGMVINNISKSKVDSKQGKYLYSFTMSYTDFKQKKDYKLTGKALANNLHDLETIIRSKTPLQLIAIFSKELPSPLRMKIQHEKEKVQLDQVSNEILLYLYFSKLKYEKARAITNKYSVSVKYQDLNYKYLDNIQYGLIKLFNHSIHKNQLSYVLKKLLAKGFISRRRIGEGKTHYYYVLLPSGKKYIHEHLKPEEIKIKTEVNKEIKKDYPKEKLEAQYRSETINSLRKYRREHHNKLPADITPKQKEIWEDFINKVSEIEKNTGRRIL